MKRILIAATAVLFASAASANTANVVDAAHSAIHVGYGDLDLHSSAGRTKLSARIHSAAKSLCSEDNVRPLAEQLARAECYRAAVSGGTAQMQSILDR